MASSMTRKNLQPTKRTDCYLINDTNNYLLCLSTNPLSNKKMISNDGEIWNGNTPPPSIATTPLE